MKRVCLLLLVALMISCNEEDSFVVGLDTKGNGIPEPEPFCETCYPELRIKNLWRQTYFNMNAMDKPVSNGDAEPHWQFVPVEGSSSYYIRENVFNSYLSVNSSGTIYLRDDVVSYSEWILEPVNGNTGLKPGDDGALFRIRSVELNLYLNVENGPIELGDILPGWLSAQWLVE